MQCELFGGPDETTDSDGYSSRTSPASSAADTDEILLRWLERWLGASLAFREMDGKTPELLLANKGKWSGASWTRNGSEWRKGGVVCSLSQILETGQIESRYFLSATACSGILRRAEKRGKALPEPLRQALAAVAEQERQPQA